MKRVLRFLQNLLRIRRVEFRIAEIPILMIPILLERSLGAPALRTSVLVEGLLVFFFLFAFGDMINCLADRDLDAIYKTHLSRAVYDLGVPFVWLQTIVSAIAAIGISLHLAWSLDRWLIVALVAIGLALGAAYSVPPVRLKGRGIAQALCLWAIIFFGPMLFSALLVSPMPSPWTVGVAAAYATIQMGVVLVNTAEDYPEDLAEGVHNTIVTLGLERGVALAASLAQVGGCALVVLLCALTSAAALPLPWAAALLAPCAATIFVAYDIRRVAHRIAGAPMDEAARIVKQEAKRVPIWITLIAWTTCAAAAALYGFAAWRPAG